MLAVKRWRKIERGKSTANILVMNDRATDAKAHIPLPSKGATQPYNVDNVKAVLGE